MSEEAYNRFLWAYLLCTNCGVALSFSLLVHWYGPTGPKITSDSFFKLAGDFYVREIDELDALMSQKQ